MVRRNRRQDEMNRVRARHERGARMELVRQPSHTDATVEPIDESEKKEGDGKQSKRELIGGGVLDGLHVIVNGNGDSARGAGEIATDHEDDAKFAESVG